MKTLEQIYSEFPELEEIAIRLEDSEKAASQKNRERKSSSTKENGEFQMSSETKKRSLSVNPEVSRISDFYKDKRWHSTSFISKPGRKEFETNLMRVIETRNPDAIKVKVFPSSRELTCRLDQTFWLNKDEFSTDAEKQPSPQNNGLGAIETAIENLKKEFAENSKAPNQGNDMQVQLQIMQLNQAAALKDIKHEAEIERIKRDYEDKIKEYQQVLDEKDAEIEDLEQELADVEESLDGIDEKIEAAKNPSWIDLAGKAVSRGLENLAKDNTKLVGDFLGMTEAELTTYFKEKEDKAKQITTPASTTTASYSTTETTDNFAHLSDDKRRYAESFLAMIEVMSIEDLKMLVTLVSKAVNEDGSLNHNTVSVLLQVAMDLKKEETEETE
jgi:hypothetical protein